MRPRRARRASADGMGGLDGVHFLLDDGQEAQRSEDGKGISVGDAQFGQAHHQLADVGGPDEHERDQHHDRQTEEVSRAFEQSFLRAMQWTEREDRLARCDEEMEQAQQQRHTEDERRGLQDDRQRHAREQQGDDQ